MRNDHLRKLIITSLLITIAFLSRTYLQGIPSVQLVSPIVLLIGFMLGKRYGLLAGVVLAVLTSFTTMFGYWTIFQALGWGLMGYVAGLLKYKPTGFIVWSALSGLVFGVIMNVSSVIMMGFSLEALIAFSIGSAPFDAIHMIQNVVFVLLLTVPLERIMERMVPSYVTLDGRYKRGLAIAVAKKGEIPNVRNNAKN